jgi:hypothetical protein
LDKGELETRVEDGLGAGDDDEAASLCPSVMVAKDTEESQPSQSHHVNITMSIGHSSPLPIPIAQSENKLTSNTGGVMHYNVNEWPSGLLQNSSSCC